MNASWSSKFEDFLVQGVSRDADSPWEREEPESQLEKEYRRDGSPKELRDLVVGFLEKIGADLVHRGESSEHVLERVLTFCSIAPHPDFVHALKKLFGAVRRTHTPQRNYQIGTLVLLALSECQRDFPMRATLLPWWLKLCSDPNYGVAAYQGVRTIDPLEALKHLHLLVRLVGPMSTDIGIVLRGIRDDIGPRKSDSNRLSAALSQGLSSLSTEQVQILRPTLESAFGRPAAGALDKILPGDEIDDAPPEDPLEPASFSDDALRQDVEHGGAGTGGKSPARRMWESVRKSQGVWFAVAVVLAIVCVAEREPIWTGCRGILQFLGYHGDSTHGEESSASFQDGDQPTGVKQPNQHHSETVLTTLTKAQEFQVQKGQVVLASLGEAEGYVSKVADKTNRGSPTATGRDQNAGKEALLKQLARVREAEKEMQAHSVSSLGVAVRYVKEERESTLDTLGKADKATEEAKSIINSLQDGEFRSLVQPTRPLRLDADTVRFYGFLIDSSLRLAIWSDVIQQRRLRVENPDFALDEFDGAYWPDSATGRSVEIFQLKATRDLPDGSGVFYHRVASRVRDLSKGKYNLKCAIKVGNEKGIEITSNRVKVESSEQIGIGGGDVIGIPIQVPIWRDENVRVVCSNEGKEAKMAGDGVSGIFFDPRQYNARSDAKIRMHLSLREKMDYAIAPRYTGDGFDLKTMQEARIEAPGQLVEKKDLIPETSVVDPSWLTNEVKQYVYCVEFEEPAKPVVVFFQRGTDK